MTEESQWYSVLQVIDRLEVGPLKLEKRRLVVPYQVYQAEQADSYELIYSYEEDVFQPQDRQSINLASLMAAQVALNYGLFCKQIVFHGIFDDHDRKWLREMAENTAREIFVNKLLSPNPFLVGKIKELPVKKWKNYLLASLSFPSREQKNLAWQLWPTAKNKHAVLSSGGKDSLVSFGLLKEAGYEVHPIFINESGRHWFTALNSYRYFQQQFPETAKVWTNSDRLFAWMLRHLPFIRKDFASIRSDMYPIRLWTVAVFLFGALPLLKKRGIGRLVIGDEFDTTDRGNFQGIPHYKGLYDQSRYFDHALSRYYLRKGWNICQFSLLRPLSELLIQKILVTRYPELQQQQLSCHATHKEGERMLPCGKCEKCRRIVSMLLALGADPGRCGYDIATKERILQSLVTKGVNQEEAAQRQLLFLLQQKGVIELPPEKAQLAKEHKEVMQVRFDTEHSPFDILPLDLRSALYPIYLEHAEGALLKIRGKWREFALLEEEKMWQKPYPFEVSVEGESADRERGEGSYLWGKMTWQEAEKKTSLVDIALLPVGAIEQHGPHLPLDTDSFDADYLARRVAAACADPKPLVLPLLPYGVSYHHDHYRGTLSISNSTLADLVYDVGVAVARNGIKKLVIINGHGGNAPTLNHAAQMINRDTHIFVCVDSGETSDVDIDKLVVTPNDVHAGEIETSTSLAVRPEAVKMDKAEASVPRFSSRYLDFTSHRGISWYAHTEKFSSNGVMGDPTKASREKGEQIWQIMVAHLVALVEDLKNLPLQEIYQRKY